MKVRSSFRGTSSGGDSASQAGLRSVREPSSFRDPAGYLFVEGDTLYRGINPSYGEQYASLIESGLYQTLIDQRLLVPHQEVPLADFPDQGFLKVLKPDCLPFISYPYEWCFSQLQQAALLTLKIQRLALAHGMTLKDSSAYNVQFVGSDAIFIDTLSFDLYQEDEPWIAYRQFCQQFLGPLALQSYRDLRLQRLSQLYLDGAELDLVCALLPLRALMRPSLFTHLYLNARFIRWFQETKKGARRKKPKVAKQSQIALIDHLSSAVRRLSPRSEKTEWSEYYRDTNYSKEGVAQKKQILREFLATCSGKLAIDFGSNTGVYSRIAAETHSLVVSCDVDVLAVERNFRTNREQSVENILPLVLDICNPSPGIGWQNSERMSMIERGVADTGLALALVHHLAITHAIPLAEIAYFFSQVSARLVIEFVPKSDSQVQRLLRSREDVFSQYSEEEFRRCFSKYFTIERTEEIVDSQRVLFLMSRIAI